MNNVVEGLADKVKWVARLVGRRKWLVLGVAWVVGLVAAAVISQLPNRYQATATVYVDTDTVLKPLMAGLTYQPDIDQQVHMLARTLISRPNMERLFDALELGHKTPSDNERDEVVSRLMKKIQVEPTSAGANLYEITFSGMSPEMAKRVVDATVQMFVYSGVGAKKRDSQGAGRFIDDQIKHYETKLTEAENRLKDFKARNFGVSGVSNQDYFSRVSSITEDVRRLRIDLTAAEQARDAYSRELAAEDPELPAELADKYGKKAVETPADAELEAQKRRLEELLNNYTEAHPEVINTRRIIEKLEAEAKARKEAEDRARNKLGKAATSPVYQRLRISLADAEAQVASLRSQLAAQQERLDQIRGVASRVPQVEAELAQLNRDYDIIRKNYDQMVARREAASLGVKLDESAQLTEFKVIEPARVLPHPVFPSRLHMALIAAVAALVVGMAVAVLADLLWPTFDEAAALRMFAKRPVLGVVPMLVTRQDQRARRMGALRFTAASAALVMMQATWLTWIASH